MKLSAQSDDCDEIGPKIHQDRCSSHVLDQLVAELNSSDNEENDVQTEHIEVMDNDDDNDGLPHPVPRRLVPRSRRRRRRRHADECNHESGARAATQAVNIVETLVEGRRDLSPRRRRVDYVAL